MGQAQSSAFYERIMLYGADIRDGSNVRGIGVIRGYMSNATFNGYGSFLRDGNFIILTLFPDARIIRGGSASGNGWIAGDIKDGGVGNFSGSDYFHSGISPGAAIGANGNAGCYFHVDEGELNKSICNQVYMESRDPDVMNLDKWLNGDPWPWL